MRPSFAGLLLFAASCGHTPPGKWNAFERELCQRSLCYRVGPLGPSWQLVHVDVAEVGFYERDVGGVIQANASCRDDAEAVPLRSLTRNLLIGYTDRRVVSEERTTLVHREALHTVVEAQLDGVPMMLDLFVVRRNGCVFDLTYAAPPPTYPLGQPDFARFVGGFEDERKPIG